jgi:hypothetical protein
MELAQDHVQWQALVLAVLNLRVMLPGFVRYRPTISKPSSVCRDIFISDSSEIGMKAVAFCSVLFYHLI